MNEKDIGTDSERTTLNLSVSAEDKKFLKVFAAQNETTISSMIHDYVNTLKTAGSDKDASGE